MDQSQASEVDILAMPVSEIDFAIEYWVDKRMNTQIRNALQRAGIRTVGELVKHTRGDLKDKVQGCGIVGGVIIDLALRKKGLALKDPEEPNG